MAIQAATKAHCLLALERLPLHTGSCAEVGIPLSALPSLQNLMSFVTCTCKLKLSCSMRKRQRSPPAFSNMVQNIDRFSEVDGVKTFIPLSLS